MVELQAQDDTDVVEMFTDRQQTRENKMLDIQKDSVCA